MEALVEEKEVQMLQKNRDIKIIIHSRSIMPGNRMLG